MGLAGLLYITVYYILNLFIVQNVMKTPYCNNTEVPTHTTSSSDAKDTIKAIFFETNTLTDWIADWNIAENNIAFTFFLGTYVSTLLARWWQQVSAIPKLDDLISALHTDSGISQEKRKDAEIAEKDRMFKNKIIRYSLLAIFLRLADLSSKVRRNFSSKDDYIKKGLLTEDEYEAFSQQKGMFEKITIDGMSCKWFIPLNWAAFTARDVSRDPADPSLKEHKEIVKELSGIQKKLLQLTDFKVYSLPGLINQAVTLVIAVYFLCGLIASQGTQSCVDVIGNNPNAYGGPVGATIMAMAMNFPFFQIMKYFLILTWFRVGKYLQRPFGHDR